MERKVKGYKVFNPDWTCRGKQYSCPGNFEEDVRSEEHTSELQSRFDLVCRLLLEKKNKQKKKTTKKKNK